MRRERPTWLGGVGALLVAIGCTVATGLPGFVAGTVFFVLWYTVPTLYTVAFGQLVVAALADDIGVAFLVPMELGLLAVLVGPSLRQDRPGWRIGVTSGVAALFGGGALAVYRWGGRLPLVVVAVVLVVGVVSYGLHRYEHVALGLVEDNI